jgi:hypothetical protein
MSTNVEGFKPPDETWKKMYAAYLACKQAGIDPPKEVDKYFNYDTPDENGVVITEKELKELGAIREYRAEMCDGYEIVIAKLPKDVSIVRVYNSY